MAKATNSTQAKPTAFTPLFIEKLKATGNRLEISEPGGLRLVVGQRTKTWIFRYKSPVTDKARKHTLGKYPELSLKKARIALEDARELIDQGVDPAIVKLTKKKKRRDAITIKNLVDDYLEVAKTRKRSWAEDQQYLKRELIPRFGDWKASMVSRSDILGMIDEIFQRAPSSASRTLVFTKLLFAHALYHEYIEA